MHIESKILISGSNGMVGRVLTNRLNKDGYINLLTPTSNELDLRDQQTIIDYFKRNEIEYVFHLAAKVGGIAANIRAPAEFLYNNLMIDCNVIEAAKSYNVRKLLYLGSSCTYPRNCKQPMKEEYILSGYLEPTNLGYALAKICGLKLCEFYNKQFGTNFISLVAPNLYGIYDHFDSENSHVISALISKFDEAKVTNDKYVEVWGTGKAKREFLYVEDLVDALLHFMVKIDHLDSFINVGTGVEISIKDLSLLLSKIVDIKKEIIFDNSKPDGMIRKKLDISRSKDYGWKAQTSLEEGLLKTYDWYKKNKC